MQSQLLQTEHLHFAYGKHIVIDDVNLQVPRGKVYGFLGRNGSGKTTTIKMLLGILEPKHGTIHFLDRTVRRTTPSMKKRIGYVSQHQHFYDWMKVRRLGKFVAGFYPSWQQQVFDELLGRLLLDPKQRVGELSGGSKMKLAMALALAHQPELLILDEPTAGVDPIARREILDLLRSVAVEQSRTVLFSTHHIGEVEEIGDVVGVLHQGSLAYQGPVENFVAHVVAEKQCEIEEGDLEGAFLALVAQ